MNCRAVFILANVVFVASSFPALAGDEKSPQLVPPSAKSMTDNAQPAAPEAIAHRIWTITEVVLQNHIHPPTRQAMLQGSLERLVPSQDILQTRELSRRISEVTREERWTALLGEVWQVNGKGQKTVPAERVEAMLEGLSRCVPGETGLLGPAEMRIMEQTAGNRYVGTGIQLTVNSSEKLTQVVKVFRNGPAYRAGMRDKDLIVAVDGVQMRGKEIREVVDRIRGDEGTAVAIDVRQPDTQQIRPLKMTRGTVPFVTVVGYRKVSEEDWDFHVDSTVPIAYLKIESITSSAVHELRQKEAQLKADGFRALVLDLRGTSGGRLHDAALLADAFLDGGVMWRVRDAQNKVKDYRADRDCLFRDWPVAVLVNDRPVASVNAVVAAWQDNHRVIVVGERSRGDWYVNELVTLPEGLGMLRLRTSLIERAGPSPAGGGLKPDHEVRRTPGVNDAELLKLQTSAESLRSQTRNAPKHHADVIDPQLAKAVEVLKAALRLAVQTPKGG